MALQEFPSKMGQPLKGGGVDDYQAVVQSPDFFKLNGLTQRDQRLIRMYGKRLTLSLPGTRITSIHFNNKGKCFIQTDTALYSYLETDITGDQGQSDPFL